MRVLLFALIALLAGEYPCARAASNQTMRIAARTSRNSTSGVQDAEGQGDGEGHGEGDGEGHGEVQHPTAIAEHEHRELTDAHASGLLTPGAEASHLQEHNGYEVPTRHIHIHQHHLGAVLPGQVPVPVAVAGTGPVQSLGLSHYRASAPGSLDPYHQDNVAFHFKDQQDAYFLKGLRNQQEAYHLKGHQDQQEAYHLKGHQDQQETYHLKGHQDQQEAYHLKGHQDQQEAYHLKNHQDQQEAYHLKGHQDQQEAYHHKGHHDQQGAYHLKGHQDQQEAYHPKGHQDQQDAYHPKEHKDQQDAYFLKNHQDHPDAYYLQDHHQDAHHKGHHDQRHYSVHEEQEHQPHQSQQALHTAIAASHPVAGEAMGEQAGPVEAGGSLAPLSYPLIGPAPYDSPKEIHSRPKHLHKGKSSHSLWQSALRVVAGLAPLALLVAAIQPNVIVIDPRLGTRQRSAGPHLQCERRAVCEAARASGPHALRALLLSTPPATAHAIDLEAVSKAVEANTCSRFPCDQYDMRANLTSAALLPTALSSSSSSSTISTTTTTASPTSTGVVITPKERKRKKVVRVKKAPKSDGS